MGRLKVTPKGKVKKNIPITRIGKKQYLKRRFAHIRAVDVAGADNKLTQKYIAGKHLTATQGFSHLGLRLDASKHEEKLAQEHLKIPKANRKVGLFQQEEERIKAQEAYKKANYIARPVSEQEGSMTAMLLQTYGMDIKRMTYDHRLNPFQLNARQLQRQIVNYLKWEKAAFPKQFAEAERRGWFSVESYADPKLRLGIAATRGTGAHADGMLGQSTTLSSSSTPTSPSPQNPVESDSPKSESTSRPRREAKGKHGNAEAAATETPLTELAASSAGVECSSSSFSTSTPSDNAGQESKTAVRRSPVKVQAAHTSNSARKSPPKTIKKNTKNRNNKSK